MTVKVIDHRTQVINRADKSGGPYTIHKFYVDNDKIQSFVVGENEGIPTITDGMINIAIASYITNDDSSVRYMVDSSVIMACE